MSSSESETANAWYEQEVDEADYRQAHKHVQHIVGDSGDSQLDQQQPSSRPQPSSGRENPPPHHRSDYHPNQHHDHNNHHHHHNNYHGQRYHHSQRHYPQRYHHHYRDRDRDRDMDRDRENDHHPYQQHGHPSHQHPYYSRRHSSQRYPSHPSNHRDGDDDEVEDEADGTAPSSDDESDEEPECPLCMEALDETDIQFKPCKCGYQVCLWCFPAGTPITLASGMAMPIEELTQDELIMAYDMDEAGTTLPLFHHATDVPPAIPVASAPIPTSGIVLARNARLIHQGYKSLIELKLEDGETLRCTPTHRLLIMDSQTRSLQWLEAEKIDLERHRLRMTVRGHNADNSENDIAMEKDWTLTFGGLPVFDMRTPAGRHRSVAFARVLGYCMGAHSHASTLRFPSTFDATAFREDWCLVSGERHTCDDQRSSTVAVPPSLIDVLAAFPSSTPTPSNPLPTFLVDTTCPPSIRREFLAAYISAVLCDGVEEASTTAPVVPLATGLSLHLSARNMEQMRPLLASCDLDLSSAILSPSTSIRFSEQIGLRYAHTYASRMAIAVSYWRSQRIPGMLNTDSTTFERYLHELDADVLFSAQAMNRAMLPSYSMRVISRSTLSSPPEPVYDLAVLSSNKSPRVHSFVAGGVIAHNCFHQINENMGGKCPACRQPYDTTGQMASDVAGHIKAGQGARKKKSRKNERAERKERDTDERERPRFDVTPSGKVGPIPSVRVLQRNLLYVVGLPMSLANTDLLKKRDYFGKYGQIRKIALNTRGGAHAARQTCSLYVTYKRGMDCSEAIKAVNGSIILGCLLRATYGTSKWCANYLRGQPCLNASCLYLHDLAEMKDCTTKEELSASMHDSATKIDVQAIVNNGLPGAVPNGHGRPQPSTSGGTSGSTNTNTNTSSSSSTGGSTAQPPPISRTQSLGAVQSSDQPSQRKSSNVDESDENWSEKPQPTAQSTPPSSWASLASSSLSRQSSEKPQQSPQQGPTAAPSQPPSGELLNANEIIYIAPLHLQKQATHGRRSSGASTVSTTSAGSRKATMLPAEETETSSTTGDEAAAISPQLTSTSPILNAATPSPQDVSAPVPSTASVTSSDDSASQLASLPVSRMSSETSVGQASMLNVNTSSSQSTPMPQSTPGQAPTPSPSSGRPPPGFGSFTPAGSPAQSPTSLASPAMPTTLSSLMEAFPAIDPNVLMRLVDDFARHSAAGGPQLPLQSNQPRPISSLTPHTNVSQHTAPTVASSPAADRALHGPAAFDSSIISYGRPISQLQPPQPFTQSQQQESSFTGSQDRPAQQERPQQHEQQRPAPPGLQSTQPHVMPSFLAPIFRSQREDEQRSLSQPPGFMHSLNQRSPPRPQPSQQQQQQLPSTPQRSSQSTLSSAFGEPTNDGFTEDGVPSDWQQLADDDAPLNLPNAQQPSARMNTMDRNDASWGFGSILQGSGSLSSQQQHPSSSTHSTFPPSHAQPDFRDASRLWQPSAPSVQTNGWPTGASMQDARVAPITKSSQDARVSMQPPRQQGFTSRFGFALEDDEQQTRGSSQPHATHASAPFSSSSIGWPPSSQSQQSGARPSTTRDAPPGIKFPPAANHWENDMSQQMSELLNNAPDAFSRLALDQPNSRSHTQPSQPPHHIASIWGRETGSSGNGFNSMLPAPAHPTYPRSTGQTDYSAPFADSQRHSSLMPHSAQPPSSLPPAQPSQPPRGRAPLSVQRAMQQQQLMQQQQQQAQANAQAHSK